MGLWLPTEQMLTKEALIECPIGRQQSFPNERNMRPSLKAFTMTVETVVHDMSAVYLLLMVYLPKDDITFICGSNEVVIKYTLDLFWRKVESLGYIRRKPSPKSTIR